MQSLSRILRIARATAHAVCGWLAYRLGWHAASRRQFERVLLLRGADFRAYVHLGRIAFDHGDYAGWRREFEHARRTDPIRFARLRHPIELFEPRLAGTQFEGSSELDGFQAADSRATWRALHPFQDPRGMDPRGMGQVGDELGSDELGKRGNNLIHGKPKDDGRTPEGYGRGTDLPLAPGYDPMTPGQQLDDGEPDETEHEQRDAASGNGGGEDAGDPHNVDPHNVDPLGLDKKRRDPDSRSNDSRSIDSRSNDSRSIDSRSNDSRGNDSRGQPFTGHPSWNTPDASLSRDDFSSPTERRRFQLRRPIDSQEIARCDLSELARRLSS